MMAVSRRPSGATSKREVRNRAAPAVGSGDKFAEASFPNVVTRAPKLVVKRSAGKRSKGARGGR
jgi:hypothetical protein